MNYDTILLMPTSLSESIYEELQGLSNPERKEKIAGYLKTSSLEFIGVVLPEIHRSVKKQIKGLDLGQYPRLMEQLWKIETFETRYAAIDVMKEYAKKGPVETALEIADSWINVADTWAIVDPLCSPCIGSMILRDSVVEVTLRSWRNADNFWRRRSSVLPFLHLALKTQYIPDLNEKIIEAVTPHISDEEFFVGKAAGWVLRELSKRDPDLIRDYFDRNREKMTKLVIREGSKKL